jgi:hypothetical protein
MQLCTIVWVDDEMNYRTSTCWVVLIFENLMGGIYGPDIISEMLESNWE